MRFGEFEIYPLSDGYFALDGGAMFGIIPKTFWEKTNPPDERNRIRLALRTLLIKTPYDVVLVDTGIGDKFNSKFLDIYRVDKTRTIEKSLSELGISLDEVSIVINTHLHFDHAGGNTRQDQTRRVTPKFPKARYFIQSEEWIAANSPDLRSRASYLREDFLPLEESGNLCLVSGNCEITKGVEVIKTGGHTKGHQIVLVRSNGMPFPLVYWGDLIPTTSHLKIPYIMGYDLFPLTTMAEKERLLKQALKEGWLMVFEHDPEIAFAFLEEDNRIRVYEG